MQVQVLSESLVTDHQHGQPLASKINDLIAVTTETGLHFYDSGNDEYTQVQPIIDGEIRALAVDGDALYVVNGEGSLNVYEADDTYNTYTDAGFSNIGGLGFYNSILYVFTYEEGIHSFSGSSFSEVAS